MNGAAMVENAIRMSGVSKVFGKPGAAGSYRAVDNLDLEVREGEMLALLGKTGGGKSTIFNMIDGLTEPSTGEVKVSGRNPFADVDFANPTTVAVEIRCDDWHQSSFCMRRCGPSLVA